MAQISDTVKTWFLGDSTGLVNAVGKANAALDSNIKKERQAASVKNSLLDPGRATLRGADALVKKLKLSAATTGTLGAGIVAFASVMRKAGEYAGESADKFRDINESMRQASRINVFATSADGVDSISQKLATLRGQAMDARGLIRENDLYGFGGGLLGTSKTVIGQFQSGLKESLGMGPYSNFDREDDEKKMTEQRLRINAQEQAKLTKLRSQATYDDLRITKERLQADHESVQIASLELEKTRALAAAKEQVLSVDDQKRVAERYDVQIAALREEQQSDTRRNTLASRLLGIEASISSEHAKKIRSAQLLIDANKEELATQRNITTERRRQMQLESMGAQVQIEQATRAALMGKSPGAVNAMIRHDINRRLAVSRFDARQNRTGGLVNASRDMSGNITQGYDPILGMWRAPRTGTGQGEHGLRTGSLSDAARSTSGGASLIHDLDPNGGLSTSGTTGRMFERSSASIALDKPTAASAVLNRHDGDPAHDPAARLARASIFRDFSQGMSTGLKTGHVGDIMSGVARVGGPNMNRRAGESQDHYQKRLTDLSHRGINDKSAGHTALSAAKAQVAATNISNAYLKQIQTDISMMAASWGFS